MVFENYARYYDLLYKDKDYQSEADYVHKLIQQYTPSVSSILELGCGTGKHAELLAQKGYTIQGIDQSENMLVKAWDRCNNLPENISKNLSFLSGDIRTLRLNKTYDAVISLFHVMSYQATNEDLKTSFATVKEHLKPDGIFIFDCWYGPAVLTDKPVKRTKCLEDEKIKVNRTAIPVIYPNTNCVDVNYNIEITDKISGDSEIIQESHRMRYLFIPEIQEFLENTGMEILFTHEWMTEKTPDFNSWNVCFGARL